MTSKVYKTANGKTLDLGALMLKNENVRAVGNMKVNARGDTIDSANRVIKPVTEKTNDRYSKTVGNRSAQVVKAPVAAVPDKQPVPVKQEVKEELTKEEIELDLDQELDDEIEVIKAKDKETKEVKDKESKKNNGRN